MDTVPDYGLKSFQTTGIKTIFVLDYINESNIYNLMLEHMSLGLCEFSTNINLCCLDDPGYIQTTKDGVTLLHLFILSDSDKNILIIDNEQFVKNNKTNLMANVHENYQKNVLSFRILKKYTTSDVINKLVTYLPKSIH